MKTTKQATWNWVFNKGVMPVNPSTMVDLMWDDGTQEFNILAGMYSWLINDNVCNIEQWRLASTKSSSVSHKKTLKQPKSNPASVSTTASIKRVLDAYNAVTLNTMSVADAKHVCNAAGYLP